MHCLTPATLKAIRVCAQSLLVQRFPAVFSSLQETNQAICFPPKKTRKKKKISSKFPFPPNVLLLLPRRLDDFALQDFPQRQQARHQIFPIVPPFVLQLPTHEEEIVQAQQHGYQSFGHKDLRELHTWRIKSQKKKAIFFFVLFRTAMSMRSHLFGQWRADWQHLAEICSNLSARENALRKNKKLWYWKPSAQQWHTPTQSHRTSRFLVQAHQSPAKTWVLPAEESEPFQAFQPWMLKRRELDCQRLRRDKESHRWLKFPQTNKERSSQSWFSDCYKNGTKETIPLAFSPVPWELKWLRFEYMLTCLPCLVLW